MLKITTRTEAANVVLELEGRLRGPWVQELEGAWKRAVIINRPVKVILRAVAFIDAAGRTLLGEMHREGAELLAEGCMTKAIVEEITNNSQKGCGRI